VTTELGPADVVPVSVDIADSRSVADAFAAVRVHLGALHGLFNNAGVARVNDSGRAEDISDGDWALMLQVNLTGCFFCCRAAISMMEASGGGSIVNNASTAALVAEPGLEAYSAAKGGVVALTRALAASSARRGVRVNAVCPGPTRPAAIGTPLTQRLRAATLLDVAGPDALSGLVAYLLSAESAYMT
jgi:NAD(P)-dependent dehydrogenase (short-subunit alcohol dehydrogenase family)